MKRPKPKGKGKGKPKGLTARRMVGNIFSGLDSKKPQQFGRTFGRAVRQPNRRTGR